MRTFQVKPVAWLTTAAVVVGALLEADREWHVLPGNVGHWLGFAAGALALIVAGVKAHGAVTPLADPKTADGRPAVLKPVSELVDPARNQPGGTVR